MAAEKPWDLCERTFLFSCDIVQLCRKLSREPGASRQISGQLLDAGTSVGANTEEARASYTPREFACKNSLVLRESRESRYWLRLIAATGLAPQRDVADLLQESNELVGIFTATVKTAKARVESEKEKGKRKKKKRESTAP